MTLTNVLIVSAVLFGIGLFGALTKRSAIVVLMCIEIMFNAVNLAAIAFSRFTLPAGLVGNPAEVTVQSIHRALTGQMFAIFVITVAAAEVALGLALIIAVYRNRKTVEVTELDLMKG